MLLIAVLLSGCTLPFGFSLDDLFTGMGADPTLTLPPPKTSTSTPPEATPFYTTTPTEAFAVPTVTSDGPPSGEESTATPGTVDPTEESDPAPTMTPTVDPETTEAPETTVSPEAEKGAIHGEVLFPAPRSEAPPFRVVAFDQNSEAFYYTVTRKGGPEFELNNLPPGEYVMVAYIIPSPGNRQPDWKAGYSEAVLCGLGDDCTDHTLVVNTLAAGETVEGITPGDWYAEPGTYPDDPTLKED
jgi:hypothetical protein